MLFLLFVSYLLVWQFFCFMHDVSVGCCSADSRDRHIHHLFDAGATGKGDKDDSESDISREPNFCAVSNSGRIPWQDVAIMNDMFRVRSLIERFYAWRRPENPGKRAATDEALRQAVEDADRAAHIAEVEEILQQIATQQNEHASGRRRNREREWPVRHPLPVEPMPDVKDRVVIRFREGLSVVCEVRLHSARNRPVPDPCL